MNRRTTLRGLLGASAGLALAGCNGWTPPRLGPVGGDSHPLSRAVYKALQENPTTAGIIVQVYTSNEDTVTLKGRVDTANEVYEAERIASRVEGVRSVINALYEAD